METLCLKLWAGHLYKLRRIRVQVLNLEGPHTQSSFWRIFHYYIQHIGNELLNSF